MAQYDRQILVPYLRDVCSVELLCEKLAKDVRKYQELVWDYNGYLKRKPESEEVPYMSDFDGVEISTLAIIMFGMFGSVFVIFGSWFARILLGIPGILALISGIGIAVSEKSTQKHKYEEAYRNYQYRIRCNQEMEEENKNYKRKRDATQIKLDKAKAQLKKAQQFRENVYDVNIIPRSYRNVHAAYYLYDYFTTARENDLDKVIQTLLLDEIKARLDKIILQNQEILLNQRYQIALEEHQNQMVAENHRKQMLAAARLEKNQELQMDYQNMIAKNQMVTNFFLEADYWRKS